MYIVYLQYLIIQALQASAICPMNLLLTNGLGADESSNAPVNKGTLVQLR